MDALFLNAALADEVGGDAAVGGEHDGAHVQSARTLEHDGLQIRIPVADLIAEGVGERVRRGGVAGVREGLRQREIRRESELGQALDLVGLLVDVSVAVEHDPGAGWERPLGERQRIGPGAAQDRRLARDLPQEHPVVARAADHGESQRLGLGAERKWTAGNVRAAAQRGVALLGQRDVEGVATVRARCERWLLVGEAQIDVLDLAHQHAEGPHRVASEEPVQRDVETEPLQAQVAIGDRVVELVVLLREDRRSGDGIRARLREAGYQSVRQQTGLGGARAVVDDDGVARLLHAFAALDDDASLDAAHAEGRGPLERERRRIDLDGCRLDLGGVRHELASLVADAEPGHADPDQAVDDQAEEGPRVLAGRADVERQRRIAEVRDRLLPRVIPEVDGVLDGALCPLHEGVRADERRDQRVPEAEVEVEREVVEVAYLLDEVQRRGQLHLDGRRLVAEGRRIEDERRVVAAEVNHVVAAAAVNRRRETLARAEDVELVVATAAEHLEGLDAAERHQASGPGHGRVRDHEGVRDRGADDHEGVDAGAAVDLHGPVLEVAVPVAPRAAEDVGQVRDLVRIGRVFLEDEERLEQEAVVPLATVQVELGAVEVDLELVVLRLAQDEHDVGVAVGQVLGVDHRHAVREFQGAIAGVGNQRNGADGDGVVTVAEVHDGGGGGVVGEQPVVAAESVDEHELHPAEGDDVARRRRPGLEGHRAGAVHAAAHGVEGDDVGPVGAVDDQLVDAVVARVADGHGGGAETQEVDDVELALVARQAERRIAPVVQRQPAGPRGDEDRRRAHDDRAVRIVDDHDVSAAAAVDLRHLEEAVEVLDDGAAEIPVGLVEQPHDWIVLSERLDELLFRGSAADEAAGQERGVVGPELRHLGRLSGLGQERDLPAERSAGVFVDLDVAHQRERLQQPGEGGRAGVERHRHALGRPLVEVEVEAPAGAAVNDPLHLRHGVSPGDGLLGGRRRDQHVHGSQVVLDHFERRHVDRRAARPQRVDEGDLPGERHVGLGRGRTAGLNDADVVDVRERLERRLERRRAHVEGNPRIGRGLITKLQLERPPRRRVLQALDFGTRLGAVLSGDDLHVAVADQRAVDQGAARDRHVAVEALDQRVDVGEVGFAGIIDDAVAVVVDAVGEEGRLRRAGVDEHVEAVAAGDGVAAEAAVEHVVERRPDQPVLAGTSDEDQRDLVRPARALLRIRLTDTRGVQEVVPAFGIDGEGVPFRADALVDDHFVARGGRAPRHADRGEEPAGIRAGGAQDELVGHVGAFDQHGVGGAVVELDGIRHLAIELLAVDGLHDHPGPVHREAVPEADREARERGALEVAHHERVGAAAAIDLQMLDLVDRQRHRRPRQRIAGARDDDLELIGAGGRPRHLDEVALVAPEELQGVALAGRLAATRDDGVAVRERQHDEVVAGDALVRERDGLVQHADAVFRRGEVAVDDRRGAGDVVVAAVADDDVRRGAAEDAIVAVARVDHRESGPGMHDVVALHVGRRARLVATPDHDRPGPGRLDVVGPRVTEDERVAAAPEHDDVVAGAAVDLHGNGRARQHADRVVAGAEIGHDVRDVVEDVAATERGHLDKGLALAGAELLDDERLRVVVGGDVPELPTRPDVQVERTARVRVPALGGQAAAGLARQEHRLGQLQDADLEVGRLLDREEPEIDLHLHAEHDRHAAVALGVEGEVEADPDQGDAEHLHLHGGAAAQLEDEVGIADGVGDDLGPYPEVEFPLQPKELGAEQHGAFQTDVEVSLGVEGHAPAQRDDPEEVDVGAGQERPLVVLDLDVESSVELEHFQDLDLAEHVEHEGMRGHPEPGGAGGIQLQGARRLDVEDGDVRDDADVQFEDDSGMLRVAAEHGGASVGLEGEPAQVERDAEQQLQALRRDREIDEASGLGEAEERHGALEVQAQAGVDAARAQGLYAPGGVQREEGGHVELEAGPVPEVGVDLEVEARHDAFFVDPESAVDEVDAAERTQLHRAVDDELDAGVVARELEAEFDLGGDVHRVGDDDLAAKDEPEAAHHADLLRDDDEVARAVALEAVEELTAVHHLLLELEGVDGALWCVGVGEGVDLEQEGPAEADSGHDVAGEREENTADDTGLAGGADEHVEVHRAGQRAEERHLRAHGTRELQAQASSAGGGLDLDEADQTDHPADAQLGLDGGLDIDLAARRRARVARAVERRRRGEDLDHRGLARLEQRQERLRDVEQLVLARRVEHHGDGATDLEEIAEARQTEAGRGAHLEETGDAGVLPGGEAGHDDDQTRGRAEGDLSVADAERQLGRGEQLEPLAVDAQEEPALHPDQIRLGPRRPDAQLADELEREAEGRQGEGARQVGPVRSQTG